MRDAGQVTATDVVVLSGAAGSVGLLASQIALQAGATVIGICGTPEKAELLTGTVGLHAAVTYTGKSQAELAAELARVIKGLTGSPHATLYFDNVGGTVSEAVIQQLAPKSRVVICGQISMYNTDEEYPPPVSSTTQSLIDDRGIVRERFLVLDYADSFSESLAELCRLTTTGRLQQHETVTRSLEQAPYAFVSMMEGKNFGKALVHCAKPPPSAALFAWLRGVLPPWVRGHLSNVFASAEAFAPELPK
jgi:NADPH-dependent curcumin reductase CurA